MKILVFILCILVFGCKTTYQTADRDSVLVGYKLVGAVYSNGVSYSVVYNDKYIRSAPNIYSTWFLPDKDFNSVADYILPVTDQTFDRPYILKIINEHEVRCIWKTDTVRLYFENAYKLGEETMVFIKKETK